MYSGYGRSTVIDGPSRSGCGSRAIGRGGGSAEAGPSEGGGRETVSFEDAFDAEVRQEFGDLGPAASTGDAGGGRGGERRGGDRGRRGGGRGRR